MSETINHTRLVAVILNWIGPRITAVSGVCLYCDCPPVRVTEKPTPIEGYFPDVCLITVPSVLTILGEAKTLRDLESARSFRQMVAFLRFLRVQPDPLFILATPWQAAATAKNIVRRAKKEADADSIPVEFLSDLSENAQRP